MQCRLSVADRDNIASEPGIQSQWTAANIHLYSPQRQQEKRNNSTEKNRTT